MPLPTAPFDAAKSIFAGLSVIQIAFAATPITGVTATTAGVFTKTAHGLANGTPLRYESGTGGTGLTVGQTYYVFDANTNTFKLSATFGGPAIEPSVALSVGVFAAAIVFEAKKMASQINVEEANLEYPDATGTLRKLRTVTTKSEENFTFDVHEIKRLLDLFGGTFSRSIKGQVTMWIPDPDDATGKVALKSEDNFPAVIRRDGELGFGNSEFSQASILIQSQKRGPITWTADATV